MKMFRKVYSRYCFLKILKLQKLELFKGSKGKCPFCKNFMETMILLLDT